MRLQQLQRPSWIHRTTTVQPQTTPSIIGLQSWLKHLQFTNIYPVRITISGRVRSSLCYGVHYTDPGDNSSQYYVLGESPRIIWQANFHRYTTADKRIYYIATEYSINATPRWKDAAEFHSKYHPFGSWWELQEQTHVEMVGAPGRKYADLSIKIERI